MGVRRGDWILAGLDSGEVVSWGWCAVKGCTLGLWYCNISLPSALWEEGTWVTDSEEATPISPVFFFFPNFIFYSTCQIYYDPIHK